MGTHGIDWDITHDRLIGSLLTLLYVHTMQKNFSAQYYVHPTLAFVHVTFNTGTLNFLFHTRPSVHLTLTEDRINFVHMN
jgi:hypothetical protein